MSKHKHTLFRPSRSPPPPPLPPLPVRCFKGPQPITPTRLLLDWLGKGRNMHTPKCTCTTNEHAQVYTCAVNTCTYMSTTHTHSHSHSKLGWNPPNSYAPPPLPSPPLLYKGSQCSAQPTLTCTLQIVCNGHTHTHTHTGNWKTNSAEMTQAKRQLRIT